MGRNCNSCPRRLWDGTVTAVLGGCVGWNCNSCPMRLWDGTLTAVLGGCRMELLIYIAKACSGGHICIMYIDPGGVVG